MPFYHVTIEADGLALDGARGFIANRYVMAGTPADAERRAVAMTLHDWTAGRWKGASAQVPSVRATDSVEIGLIGYLGGLGQNRGHVFHEDG